MQTAQAIFNRLHFIWVNRLGCFLLSLTVMAIHSELSQEQHWQNWQRSCSSYSTLLTHLHLPRAIIQHPCNTIGLLTATSAEGARASEPQTTQNSPPSCPLLYILGSLLFIFTPRSRFRPFSAPSSPRISTKIERQCLRMLSQGIQTNTTSHHFIY